MNCPQNTRNDTKLLPTNHTNHRNETDQST
jgi:hypothetical protein